MKNIWKDAIMGVVTGDALGCPVQFMSRGEISCRPNGPVVGMEGFGTFNLPKGSWTDDSSLTLATLDSIINQKDVDCGDIMDNFVRWLNDGNYTPYGYAYDIGFTCRYAISNYEYGFDTAHCGKTGEQANGNGALMRIMPVVLFAYIGQKNGAFSDAEVIASINSASALTHNHPRALTACGIYYFIARAILNRAEETSLSECIQTGISDAINYYGDEPEMSYYKRLFNAKAFAALPAEDIQGTGYVVKTLEAAVWSLLTTGDFSSCLLTAVNLGDDTDTVAAIAGGLAGLYYGYQSIPETWIEAVVKADRIEALCDEADKITF